MLDCFASCLSLSSSGIFLQATVPQPMRRAGFCIVILMCECAVSSLVTEQERAGNCPEPPSVTAIIGGSIASVAVIGILLLMLIKLFIYMKDLKEYRKFENEKKKSKWAEADNPLFKNATTTVENPTFTGE